MNESILKQNTMNLWEMEKKHEMATYDFCPLRNCLRWKTSTRKLDAIDVYERKKENDQRKGCLEINRLSRAVCVCVYEILLDLGKCNDISNVLFENVTNDLHRTRNFSNETSKEV